MKINGWNQDCFACWCDQHQLPIHEAGLIAEMFYLMGNSAVLAVIPVPEPIKFQLAEALAATPATDSFKAITEAIRDHEDNPTWANIVIHNHGESE